MPCRMAKVMSVHGTTYWHEGLEESQFFTHQPSKANRNWKCVSSAIPDSSLLADLADVNCWSPEGSAWIDVFVWVGFAARPPLASAEDEWGRSDDDDPFSKVAAFTKFSLVSPLTMETSYRFTFLVRYAQNNTFPYFLTGFQNSTVPFHLSSHEHNTIILI